MLAAPERMEEDEMSEHPQDESRASKDADADPAREHGHEGGAAHAHEHSHEDGTVHTHEHSDHEHDHGKRPGFLARLFGAK